MIQPASKAGPDRHSNMSPASTDAVLVNALNKKRRMANPAISRISTPTICNIVPLINIMLLLMPANVALNIRCAGPGPDHDDRDHKEAMQNCQKVTFSVA